MEKLKVGIIGCGNISGGHIAGYKALSDKVSVEAVCDIDEERVKAYAAKHGVERWYIPKSWMRFRYVPGTPSTAR